MELHASILNQLEKQPSTARALASSLNVDKPTINRILYKELLLAGKVTMTDQTPPIWRKSDDKVPYVGLPDIQVATTHVLIDLDNCPFLEHAQVYASASTLIRGFCSPVYNHWVPAPTNPHVTLWRAKQTQKDAAEIQMTIEATTLVLNSKAPLQFILVSKDRSVETLATLLRQNYNLTVELCHSWDDLRIFLE